MMIFIKKHVGIVNGNFSMGYEWLVSNLAEVAINDGNWIELD